MHIASPRLRILPVALLWACGSGSSDRPQVLEIVELHVMGGQESAPTTLRFTYKKDLLQEFSSSDGDFAITYSNQRITRVEGPKTWAISYSQDKPTKLKFSQGGSTDEATVQYDNGTLQQEAWEGDFRRDTITYEHTGSRLDGYTVTAPNYTNTFALQYKGDRLDVVQRNVAGNANSVSFSYNNAGQVTGVTTHAWTYTVAYDGDDRIREITRYTDDDNYTQLTYTYGDEGVVGLEFTPRFDHGDLFDMHGRVRGPYTVLTSARLID